MNLAGAIICIIGMFYCYNFLNKLIEAIIEYLERKK